MAGGGLVHVLGALTHQGAAVRVQTDVPPEFVFTLFFLESATFFSRALETGELGRAGDCFSFRGGPPATDPHSALGGEPEPMKMPGLVQTQMCRGSVKWKVCL